jgi:hypothetical protein
MASSSALRGLGSRRKTMARASKATVTSTRLESPTARAVLTPPREVVRGVTLHVTGKELAVRLGERIRWHRERSDVLIEQIKKLAEVERAATGELANALIRYDSPRTLIEKKLHEHRERASFLSFVRDHITQDDTYRLDSNDLRTMEILPEKVW